MAKIFAMPNQKEWQQKSGESLDAYFERQDKMMSELETKAAKLPKGEYVGALLKFGVADGYAVYYVYSLKPLQLCHVPWSDAYRADRLIEKALNVTEVKKRVNAERALAKLFSKRG